MSKNAVFSPSLLLLIWAALNVMDALLTFEHLTWGGMEGNPLLASLQANLGTVSMLAAKTTGALIVGLFFGRIGRHRHLLWAGAGMALVVIYNAVLVPLVFFS